MWVCTYVRLGNPKEHTLKTARVKTKHIQVLRKKQLRELINLTMWTLFT